MSRIGQLVISALGPTIGEQCGPLGIEPTHMTIALVDEVSHQLTRAHIWGLLTDSEVNRARARLLKRAKFVSIKERSNG